jgi:hypothetical protein
VFNTQGDLNKKPDPPEGDAPGVGHTAVYPA